ncbi:MAG: DUF4258 domain-containing protein [bacterium]
MEKGANILDRVREAANQKILFLPHAVRQMSHPERMISAHEVREAILKGKVIEDYAEDVRGHSCLILGYGNNKRPIHVVCSPKEDYLAIITAYLPDPKIWKTGFRERK